MIFGVYCFSYTVLTFACVPAVYQVLPTLTNATFLIGLSALSAAGLFVSAIGFIGRRRQRVTSEVLPSAAFV